MAVGERMTLSFKKNQCAHCKLANKKALRKGLSHCPFPNPEIRDGQCKSKKE